MATLLLLVASVPARAGATDTSDSVRQVVMDIISYTRWPEARPDLRLCVVGVAQYAAAFLGGGLQSGTVPVRAVRLSVGDERIGTDCDVVYEGPITQPEREALLRRLANHSVLAIGEPAPGCIEVTMFCLAIRGDQVSFASNLDAIARSGVKLNPRVLLLSRRPGGVR